MVVPPSPYYAECKSILFACGLINPQLLSYLLLRILDLTPLLRRLIAILTLAFIPLNWIYMALFSPPLTPAIGHFAWIAGLLLMLVPEAVIGARGPSPVPSTAAEASPAPQK